MPVSCYWDTGNWTPNHWSLYIKKWTPLLPSPFKVLLQSLSIIKTDKNQTAQKLQLPEGFASTSEAKLLSDISFGSKLNKQIVYNMKTVHRKATLNLLLAPILRTGRDCPGAIIPPGVWAFRSVTYILFLLAQVCHRSSTHSFVTPEPAGFTSLNAVESL